MRVINQAPNPDSIGPLDVDPFDAVATIDAEQFSKITRGISQIIDLGLEPQGIAGWNVYPGPGSNDETDVSRKEVLFVAHQPQNFVVLARSIREVDSFYQTITFNSLVFDSESGTYVETSDHFEIDETPSSDPDEDTDNTIKRSLSTMKKDKKLFRDSFESITARTEIEPDDVTVEGLQVLAGSVENHLKVVRNPELYLPRQKGRRFRLRKAA